MIRKPPFVQSLVGLGNRIDAHWQRWLDEFVDEVNSAGSTPTPPAPEPEPVNFTIDGVGSIAADGSVASGAFSVSLQNDKDEPPPNSFYGANVDGTKGFTPVYDALEEGQGIAIRDSGYTVIDTVGTPDDLPLTGNAGEAVRVTESEPGLYAWDGAAFTLDPLADGTVSVTCDATAAEIPYSNATSGLTATNVQAAIDELDVRTDAGTVNPSSPTAGQRFYRTDLNLLIYYDAAGTQWLTVQQFEMAIYAGDGSPEVTTSGARVGRQAIRPDFQIYLSRWVCNAFVITTNNASNYWSVSLDWFNATNAATNIASFTTSGDTVANNVVHSIGIGAALNSNARIVAVTGTKTGTPGDLYAFGSLFYRLIVP